MDVTPDFNICLRAKATPPVLPPEFDVTKINSFLQEAYGINARISDLTRELYALRPSYLAIGATPARRRSGSLSLGSHPHSSRPQRFLKEQEKDEIDAQSKQLLRQLNHAIQNLNQAEDIRREAEEQIALKKRARGGLGAIGRWAAGGAVTAKSPEEEAEEAQRKEMAAHRESVIFYLQRKLEQASRVQGAMMEIRLTRELEKQKSSLVGPAPISASIPYASERGDNLNATTGPADRRIGRTQSLSNGYDPTISPTTTGADEPPEELSSEQQQLLMEENSELLKLYNAQLDQISTAEKSIREISELQSTLVTNIQLQSEHIDQLVQDSYLTTENLGRGNKELKKASERRSTAQAMFYITCGLCSFLVLWDLVF